MLNVKSKCQTPTFKLSGILPSHINYIFLHF